MSRALVDAHDVAAMLGISVRQVRRMAVAGELPSVKVGRWRRFRPEAVAEWVQAREGRHPRPA